MKLIDLIVIILPCIKLLKWGVYYPQQKKKSRKETIKNVIPALMNEGFYAGWSREFTGN